jgi:hypothetical protein
VPGVVPAGQGLCTLIAFLGHFSGPVNVRFATAVLPAVIPRAPRAAGIFTSQKMRLAFGQLLYGFLCSNDVALSNCVLPSLSRRALKDASSLNIA